MIYVICGPPCAGKSIYVQQKSRPGELIIDLDKICEALGAGVKHQAKGYIWEAAQEARSALIEYVLRTQGPAWIIDSLPGTERIKRYESCKASIITLDPGRDTCKARAENRPEGTKEAIDRWYARASGDLLNKKTGRNAVKLSRTGDATSVIKAQPRKEQKMKRTDITDIFPEATREQIDRLLDLNGADITAAKSGADELRGQLKTATDRLAELEKKSAADPEELQRAIKRAESAETELTALKLTNQLREIRESVAKDKGVPANLLTGDSEDACKAQADAILAFAKPGGYPPLKDGGEAGAAGASAAGGAARERFAAWAQENI